MTRLEMSAFDPYYEVHLDVDLPGSGSGLHEFPADGLPRPPLAIIVEVRPMGGSAWVGRFFGDYHSSAVSGCFACPDRCSLAVVAGGTGYVVRSDRPEDWWRLEVFPIIQVEVSKEEGLLLFADNNAMAAMDQKGLLWTNSWVSWDGLRIHQISNGTIEGVAWDSSRGQELRYRLDARTGQAIEDATLDDVGS